MGLLEAERGKDPQKEIRKEGGKYQQAGVHAGSDPQGRNRNRRMPDTHSNSPAK
jgi:hypothetical protein